jgi:signal peptidase I
VLDWGLTPQDTTDPIIVPEGMLFMMGDNRDNSQDSRRPSVAGGWVGLVPVENLVSRAEVIAFSTDGTSSWLNPISWFSAARWDRIGDGL